MEKINEIPAMDDKEEDIGLKELKIVDTKTPNQNLKEVIGNRKEEKKIRKNETLKSIDQIMKKTKDNSNSNRNEECSDEHHDDWRIKQDRKIEEKKKQDKKLKEQIRNKAKIKIEELQKNYENEVEDRIKKVEEEEKQFLTNAKSFYSDNSIWNKTNKIIDEIGNISETNARDKTRFRKLLKNYKKNKVKSYTMQNNRL